MLGKRAFHSSAYISAVSSLTPGGTTPHRFAIVGASQSAVEIALDLHTRFPKAEINMIWRGQGIKLKDTSPFTEQIYLPEFVDYYHDATIEFQRQMSAELWRSNYGAADHDVISSLNFKVYEQKVAGHQRLKIHHYHEVVSVEERQKHLVLTLKERHTQRFQNIECDLAIVATGYKNFGSGSGRELFHPLLADLKDYIKCRIDGSFEVSRDFQLMGSKREHLLPPTVINGLCESTHGFGDAGSFSLLSFRAVTIVDGLQKALGELSNV